MYFNFSTTEESFFKADVCIIGAGAAGFACAVSLLNTGIKVIVLEGGSKTFDEKAADLHRGEVSAHPHNGIHEARERIIGGTTTKWGGQALPFLKEDFEKREHVKMSGWPVSYEDLKPYYLKAESILGTDTAIPFNYRPWKEWKIKEPSFSPSTIELFVTRWCRIPNFAQQHGDKIEQSDHVHLIQHANVVELLPSASRNTVKALRICSLEGKSGIVEARYVIAAGGAMETVRLFLASAKFDSNGLGNGNGLAGAYFQDHVAATVGQVFPASRTKLHRVFDHFYKNGFKYFPRIRLSPVYAKKEKLLHASAQILFTETSGSVLNTAKAAFAKLKNKQLPAARTILTLINPVKLWDISKAAFTWKIKKRGYSSRFGNIYLEVHSEQQPVPESYITLSENTDALGMPRIKLNWSIPEMTKQTIKSTARIVKAQFEKAGLGKIILHPWVEGISNEEPVFTDTYHQAGGLRMAENEEQGVVDSSCRVFGINNLYVASSAVFPTSSFSNPTMTTIALAIRICETIEKECKTSASFHQHTAEAVI